MFTPELLQLAVDRSTGKSSKQLDSLFEELYEIYVNDPNSSTLREHITASLANCDPIAGKLGRDCKCKLTGDEKEIKPKNYYRSTTNGGGCFNDYTRLRYLKDYAVNLPIISSLFVYGRVMYVVEYKFKQIADKLDKQVTDICENKGQRYVRSCAWTYEQWYNDPNLIVHYLDKDYIHEHHVKGHFKIRTKLYEKLMSM